MIDLAPEAGAEPVLNDVVITVATSNGTGSQSANLILLRAIFNMGIPVGGKEPKLRKMVVNIMYVGVLAHLLDIEPGALQRAIERQFSSKPSAARLNADAARAGREWSQQHLSGSSSHRLAPMAATVGKIIIEGNQAAALGFVFGGLTVLAW